MAVVGAGPGGLAVASEAARRGLRVVIVEARELPADKCCGEGIMPRGLSALAEMGISLPLGERLGILRYVEPNGRTVDAELPEGGARGVRRLVLSEALVQHARSCGVELRTSTRLTGLRTERSHLQLRLEPAEEGAAELLEARLVVGADGLSSPTRRLAGIATRHDGRRYGLRKHLAVRPWLSGVEVHFGPGVEAYVTKVAEDVVNIAFLWERRRGSPVDFETLLQHFPRLRERCASARPRSPARGCGPLLHQVPSPVAGRLALLGDAAGYVDAITGEGLSLALASALSLGACLPEATVRGEAGLSPYRKQHGRLFAHYARTAHTVLSLSRSPRARGLALSALGAAPGIFERVVAWAVG